MNWAVQGCRPDLVFDLTDLTDLSSDLMKATKCIKKLKFDQSCLYFPSLKKSDSWRIIVFSDTSHANLSQGAGSMGAHIVLLVNNDGNCCTLS